MPTPCGQVPTERLPDHGVIPNRGFIPSQRQRRFADVKGLVLAGAGVLVIVATLRADPAKASGLDAAVKTLGQAPFGKVLLILAAVGIVAFGAYSFVRARHGRM